MSADTIEMIDSMEYELKQLIHDWVAMQYQDDARRAIERLSAIARTAHIEQECTSEIEYAAGLSL